MAGSAEVSEENDSSIANQTSRVASYSSGPSVCEPKEIEGSKKGGFYVLEIE